MNSVRKLAPLTSALLALVWASSFPVASRAQENRVPAVPRPVEQADTKCAVVEWDLRFPIPALTVVCPPEPIFAPLRVYLKLTWTDEEDVPKDCLKIAAPTGMPTLVRAEKKRVRVQLKTMRKGKLRHRWVNFTALTGVALMNEN